MTWFGITWVVLLVLGILAKFWAIGKDEDTVITNVERWVALGLNVLLLLGILFVGTGSVL